MTARIFQKGVIFGSSLVAFIILCTAAFFQSLVSAENPEWISLNVILNFSGAFVFLAIIIAAYLTGSAKAIYLWIIVSVVFCCGIFLQRSWGDRLLHGHPDVQMRYAIHSYLSDFLFAAGSALFLLSGIMLFLIARADRKSPL